MNVSVVLFLAVLIIGVAGIAIAERRIREKSKSSGLSHALARKTFLIGDNVPECLHGAILLMSEKTLTIKDPIYKKGTPDQVWKFGEELILSDTKTRKNIKPSDIEQMSIYRLLVEGNGYGKVANVAYVRLAARNRATHWQPVRLKSREVASKLLVEKTRQNKAISAY